MEHGNDFVYGQGEGPPATPAGDPAPSSADLPPPLSRAREGVVRRGNCDMKEYTFEELVRKENNKIKRELKKAKISGYKMKVIEPVISNVSFMKVKLDEARDQVKDETITVEYDNGGGQKGIRENPIFKAYEQLWKSYMLGMERILAIIPDEEKEEIEAQIEQTRPQTVLDKVLEKKSAGSPLRS